MELAKKKIDVGLSTNNLDPMLHFWQNDVGLRLDHVLPVRRGQKQYRHDAAGSVIKINHHVDQLPVAPPSGYRELIIARQDREQNPSVSRIPMEIEPVWYLWAMKEYIRLLSVFRSATSKRIAASMPMRSVSWKRPEPAVRHFALARA